MATTIQRRTTMAPSSALRSPFPTPGRQPEARVSALSLQGVQDDPVPYLPNLGTAASGPLTTGVYTVPTLALVDGVPTVEFAKNSSDNRGLRTAGDVAVWRSYVGVVRFGNPPATGYAHIARGGAVTKEASMSIDTDGRLVAYGKDSDTLRSDTVKAVPFKLSFMAVVFDGASSVVQIDDDVFVGPTTNPTGAMPLIIGGPVESTEWAFQVAELEAHTSVLSAAALAEKRTHYRALYQF